MHAVDFLEEKEPKIPGMVTIFGDDTFLRRLCLKKVSEAVLGNDGETFGLSICDGTTADWAEVLDAISTRSLFGGKQRRLVIVESADRWVSEHRAKLETYAAQQKSSAVMLLVVDTWPATTKLAKAVAARGLPVECKTPTGKQLTTWVRNWSETTHGKKIAAAAAELLVDLMGNELGLLDQEIGKLSALAADEKQISLELVEQTASSGKAKTTWEMLDLAAAGQAAAALAQLDRLIAAGENPIGLLAQMSFTLRKLGSAIRIIIEGDATGKPRKLRQALEETGIKTFFLNKSENQLLQLGRDRAQHLFQWQLATDLGLKGDSQLPPRTLLEQLIVRMAQHTSS